ncbi:hypothetical protein NHF48_023620 [Sphingomonas sp. H160509]|uniref:hypothetical protein n=1 Tax=Sphingomonas sp. H160509 TaxID=2955313 RepID=UPI0010E940F4|nr:hypothetical protein [Sphingomonas sp. H160509]MDD1453253.1 hypothetical protein [Sphingomonas sp. H160509]RYF13993.1 MAG: hypothetical protein EOO77_14805 [Oxalobacteraceae bacterium]
MFKLLTLYAIFPLAAFSASASAQVQTTTTTMGGITSPAVPDDNPLPFNATEAVGNDDLNAVTGQSDLTQVVNAQNNGVVSGNTVTGNSQTGTIHFDSSSFQNLNGLSLLSANTGNNVSINSSLNVNVAINH